MINKLFQPILYFFSQEALDPRLVPATGSARYLSVIKQSRQSRWRSWEFIFYLICFTVVIPTMFKTAMDLSNETNPNYWIYKGILSDGWINGRKVDNSDSQYRFFRDNLPLLVLLILVQQFLKWIVKYKLSGFTFLDFNMGLGLLFVFGIHGFNTLRLSLHCLINFSIVYFIKDRKLLILFTWLYGISTLFINDKWSSIPFGDMCPGLCVLDSFHGIVERWDVFYNFTLLRMLSFNLDYIKRRDELLKSESTCESSTLNIHVEEKSPEKAKKTLHNRSGGDNSSESDDDGVQLTRETTAPKLNYLDDRERLDAPLDKLDYNLVNYISYLTYTPLFIAGPIITFNDYIYQSRNRSPIITKKFIIIYLLRFLFCVLTMELILHYIYVVAVSKLKAWYNDTPYQISMIGLFNLNIIWLKLLIPWRLFRLWSLIDGIDPPENMIRCMNNNNSAISFWRAWHRSFSRWSIRYIYVPIGGARNRILTSLCVFSFVLIWHDIQLRLLIWGWLVVIFLLPEVIITKFGTKFESRGWYRYLCGVGSVVNIWMMLIANLFGFCLGKDGTLDFLHKLFYSTNGFAFFLLSSACLFVAVQVQNEIRESERRRGIDLKC